jgi:hypothetical protein
MTAKFTARNLAFAAAYADAYRAGLEAGRAHRPTPMLVTQTDGTPVDTVSDGACGFAWVTVRPGTSSFARWLVGQKLARSAYGGGVDIWMRDFGQSVERKAVMARVMAEALTERLGIPGVSWGSRED